MWIWCCHAMSSYWNCSIVCKRITKEEQRQLSIYKNRLRSIRNNSFKKIYIWFYAALPSSICIAKHSYLKLSKLLYLFSISLEVKVIMKQYLLTFSPIFFIIMKVTFNIMIQLHVCMYEMLCIFLADIVG